MNGGDLRILLLLIAIVAPLLLYPIRSQLTWENLSAGLLLLLALWSVSAAVIGIIVLLNRIRGCWRGRRD